MNRQGRWWVLGALLVAIAVAGPVVLILSVSDTGSPADDPRGHLPPRPTHTDHTSLMKGPYPDGPSVTRACLECHKTAAEEMARTAHWNWEGDPVQVPGHEEPVRIGKKTLVNNFCIGVQSNWPACTSCHAGYGWMDETFDFSQEENVDCLVCHDQSGTYVKTQGGLPATGVDLVVAAGSVGAPTRENCGSCHFKGGGGDAVKHGDLDSSLIYPRARIDVHMGKHDMICTDCHRTEGHLIEGRSVSVSIDLEHQIACVDCHAQRPHDDERLDGHVGAVAC